MAKLGINTGTTPNDGTGDTLLDAVVKINSNFNEIYNTFGNGTDLSLTLGTYATIAGYSTNSGIATYATIAGYSTSSGVSTTAGYATTSGISTTSQGLTGTPNITVGVITATSGVQGIGIYSGGSLVTTGIVTALNFVGTGNTFAVVGNRVDISIAGGAGAGGTTQFSRTITTFTATSNQTTFSVAYTVGYVDVYLNGARLSSSEFTASDGSTVVLVTGATLNDVIDIISYGGTGTALWNVGTGSSIYSLSSVGIGTTNPTNALTVGGGTSTTNLYVSGISTFAGIITSQSTLFASQLNVSSASTFTVGPVLISNTGTATTTNTASQPLQVTGGAYISGNTGIGSTNPNTGLVIRNSPQTQTPELEIYPTTGTYTASTRFVNTANSAAVGILNNAGSVALIPGGSTFLNGPPNAGFLGVGGAYPLLFITNNVERIRTDSSGNVGIASTQPTSTLDVNGNVKIIGVTTITGNLNAAGNYYVKIARTSNQTIPTGVDTLIGFTTMSDPNGWYAGITTRTTPTVAGTYHVQAMLNWQAGATTNANQSNIQLRKNGSTFAISIVGIQTFQYSQFICGIVTMNGSTDYIDFTAYTSNATSQAVTGDASGLYTKVEIHKIN